MHAHQSADKVTLMYAWGWTARALLTYIYRSSGVDGSPLLCQTTAHRRLHPLARLECAYIIIHNCHRALLGTVLLTAART